MNPIFDVLGSILSPIGQVVDELHTSDEEKLKARAALVELQVRAGQEMLNYEARLVEAQTSVIRAEASGHSWLQQSWRPITMLTFLALVVCDSFGWLAFRLAEQAWDLLQIGLGGYVIGRSAEKIAPTISQALKK